MKNKTKPRYDLRSKRGNTYSNDLHPFVKCKSTANSPKNQAVNVTTDLQLACMYMNVRRNGGEHE